VAKRNLPEQNASRTPGRSDVRSALERVRQAPRRDRTARFTALLHHIYNTDMLKAGYLALKQDAAPGDNSGCSQVSGSNY
jgi:hypothetical protein